eukprot:SAG31_NODE_33722_length_340_cov_1.489627_1_plen_44_part_10
MGPRAAGPCRGRRRPARPLEPGDAAAPLADQARHALPVPHAAPR